MRVATLTTWNENGYAPLGDEFGCQWCREPGSEYDTGDLKAPPIVAPDGWEHV